MSDSIEVHVSVSASLVKKAFRWRDLINVAVGHFIIFGLYTLPAWIAVAAVDMVNNQGPLISVHGTYLFGLLLLTVLYFTVRQYREMHHKGGDFLLKADDTGLRASSELLIAWAHCRWYEEFDDYVLLHKINGQTNLLPKTEAISPVLQRIRERLPSRQQARKTAWTVTVQSLPTRLLSLLKGLLLILSILLVFAAIKIVPAFFTDAPVILYGDELTP